MSCSEKKPKNLKVECGKEFNLKIGDRVVIKDYGKAYTTYEAMFKKLGFKNTSKNSCLRIYEKNIVFKVFALAVHELYSDRKLVAIETLNGKKQVLIDQKAVTKTQRTMMEKKDLKTGMVVENRDGKFSIVMLGTRQGDILAGNLEGSTSKTTWCSLDSINEDLTYETAERFDIVKVYDFSNNRTGASIIEKGDLLWERPKVKEYTMDELKEILGHDFKIK